MRTGCLQKSFLIRHWFSGFCFRPRSSSESGCCCTQWCFRRQGSSNSLGEVLWLFFGFQSRTCWRHKRLNATCFTSAVEQLNTWKHAELPLICETAAGGDWPQELWCYYRERVHLVFSCVKTENSQISEFLKGAWTVWWHQLQSETWETNTKKVRVSRSWCFCGVAECFLGCLRSHVRADTIQRWADDVRVSLSFVPLWFSPVQVKTSQWRWISVILRRASVCFLEQTREQTRGKEKFWGRREIKNTFWSRCIFPLNRAAL